jgi:hypothetical protein
LLLPSGYLARSLGLPALATLAAAATFASLASSAA